MRPGPSRTASFRVVDGDTLPFESGSFDGAFVNEVIEHVADETVTLRELRRVLRPRGVLVVISPNRWFPFEGHGIRIGSWSSSGPAPLIPWLPRQLSRPVMEAKNYWPGELVALVGDAGFDVERVGFVWPVFEQYNWLPARWSEWYHARMTHFDSLPVLRRFGCPRWSSCGRRPDRAPVGERAAADRP